MKFLVKYGIGIYILVSLVFKLGFIIPRAYSQGAFYALMAFGLVVLPLYYKVLYSKKSLKVFWLFHFINLINLVYLLFFNLKNGDSWLYFLSKYATFNLITLGLIYNYDFYKNWIVKNFKYLMLLILALGMMYGVQSVADNRLSIGFNANDVGLFGLLGLFSIITLDTGWQKNKLKTLLVILFLIAVLLSGSRAAILGIALVAFFIYGISYKTIGFALLFLIAVYIAGNFGYDTGINRLLNEKNTFEDRDNVYKAGLLTFYDAFYWGHGLDKYGWSNPKYFLNPELALGPHNAYLATGIMYGVVFGSFFLASVLRFIIKARKIALKYGDQFVKFTYYLLLLVLVNAFFESLMVGINEFINLLFWFFIGIVAIFPYRIQQEKYVPGNK